MTNSGRPELQSSGFASAEPSSSMFEQFRVPIAKSFSFVIPERFRSNNPFVVGWVDNLPGEVKREEPLAPAQTHAPKHSLVRKTFFSISSPGMEFFSVLMWLTLTRTPSTKMRKIAMTVTATNGRGLAQLLVGIPSRKSAVVASRSLVLTLCAELPTSTNVYSLATATIPPPDPPPNPLPCHPERLLRLTDLV